MVLGWLLPSPTSKEHHELKQEARSMLRYAALFLGELRDGLTMINMQNAYLIASKHYTEKQAGILFFVFGMSQFLFQTPAGYLYDYTDQKIRWLSIASIGTTCMTIITALFAADYGANLLLMIVIKFIQGAITSFIPPGLNSITQGIVGASGMTQQVSTNEMMNHLGTAIIVLVGSLLGVYLYPNLSLLFVVSPIACIGVLFFLCKINPNDIDHEEARGLKSSKSNSNDEDNDKYDPPKQKKGAVVVDSPGADEKRPTSIATTPRASSPSSSNNKEAESPLQVLRDPKLLMFVVIVFLFHTSNGTVLPLVMQTLAIGTGRTGILMSGLCIIIAQIFMVCSAHICGQYAGTIGRKPIFLVGLFIVPVRCFILTGLLHMRQHIMGNNNQEEGEDYYYDNNDFDDAVVVNDDEGGSTQHWLNFIILSTQILDGVGAGVFGTMYVLVSSDLSAGTGRFSLTLGLTTAAASIGGTVSGYLGEALAEDFGYKEAFFILMFMACIPAILYLLCMPETLILSTAVNNNNNNTNQTQRNNNNGGLSRIQEDTNNKSSSSFKTATNGGGSGYSELV